jgi:hypothetical protein
MRRIRIRGRRIAYYIEKTDDFSRGVREHTEGERNRGGAPYCR